MTDEQKYRLKPAAGRIAVKIENYESKAGLVLVGDSHNPKPTVGTVTEVCDEYTIGDDDPDEDPYEPLYKVGDVVIFGKFTGSKVQVGRDTYVLLRESEILARLIPDEQGVEARDVRISPVGVIDVD